MRKPIVVHLMDDTTPGGVTRVIDHMLTGEDLNAFAEQRVLYTNKSHSRIPVVHADVIISHVTLCWRGLPGLIALRAKYPNAKIIHIEHSYTKSFTALNVRNRARFFTLLRTTYALFDHVVAVSRTQGSWMVTRGLVAQEKMRIIRSAVDLKAFIDLPAPTGTPKVFGAMGRLHEQKGFDRMIAAFMRVDRPDIQLKIFGEGHLEAPLKKLAARDPRISLMGYCKKPEEAMSQIDALLVPSRWEAFGLVAQEALAARRLTLVSPVDGLLDQTIDGAIAMGGHGIRDWVQGIEKACDTPIHSQWYSRENMEHGHKSRFQSNWILLLNQVLASEPEPVH